MSLSESELRRRAERVFPIPAPLRHFDAPTMPWFCTGGRGARLVLADGSEVVDIIMGRGSVALGYAHPVVREAFAQHAALPVTTTLRTDAEVELAERLIALYPRAESVVFGKNGSDVCTAAVRLARTATGRNTVLSAGYHGFHDWAVARIPDVTGLPPGLDAYLIEVASDNPAELTSSAEYLADDLAAIVLDPGCDGIVNPGTYRAARAACDRHGSVLIFDEIVSGFRLGPGGAQEAFGVEADLTCLGKALGNGYPISALLGPRDLLAGVPLTRFSLTYQRDSLGFAVALACLRFLLEHDIASQLAQHGRRIAQTFAAHGAAHGAAAHATGFPARLFLRIPTFGRLTERYQAQLLMSAMVEHRVVPTLLALPCADTAPADLDRFEEAMESGWARIEREAER